MNLRNITTVCLALAASLTLQTAFAEPELKGSPGELTEYLKGLPKTVTVTGESELKIPADKAIVTLRVHTENRYLQEALKLNQSIRTKIVKALGDENIPLERIQSAKFSSTPKFGIFGDKAKSYQVENNMRITLKDEKEFQAVADIADKWPEVNYEGVEFEHSEKEHLKLKAIGQANENAVMRKKAYEETLSIKLTPKRFWENTGAVPIERLRSGYTGAPSFAGTDYEASKAITSSRKISAQGGSEPTVSESISSFGELTFKAQVTVEYAVETR